MKVKRGASDGGAVQHFLHGYVADRLSKDQLHQSTAEPLFGPPGALVGFVHLPVRSRVLNLFLPSRGDSPVVEQQLKSLTGKLALTREQQAQFKPILRELYNATHEAAQDKGLSHEERLDKVRPQFYRADKQMREILNGDQLKKLDQYEQEPHPEMHGELSGTASSPARLPQR